MGRTVERVIDGFVNGTEKGVPLHLDESSAWEMNNFNAARVISNQAIFAEALAQYADPYCVNDNLSVSLF